MRRTVAVVLAALLVLAACGRSDTQTGGGDNGSSSTTAGRATGTADFGDLTDVCQDGSPTGSPDRGVTATEIHVANFSDIGFVGRPGLLQEFPDAAKVFSEWCNDHGGINGRKIVVDIRDAALTSYVPRMIEACRDDFAMVGGGGTFDGDGVETRLRCLLPDIAGFAGSVKARGADLLVQPIPNALTSLQIGNLRYLARRFPNATDHLGVLVGDIPITAEVGKQNAAAARSLGWKVVYEDVYPAAGLADWTPYAQKLKERGVKGLVWVGEPENLGKLIQAVNDIGYRLDFVRADANHYDQKLIDTAGPAITSAPVFVQISSVPFEHPDPGSATQQYLDLFERYNPSGNRRATLGVTGFSAWLLFAQAAKSCGNDLTRRCMYDAAKKIHSWTGGGLHAVSDPGSGKSSPCFAAVEATANGFELMTDTKPDDGIFNCDRKNLFTLTDNVGQETTLASLGLSLDDMK